MVNVSEFERVLGLRLHPWQVQALETVFGRPVVPERAPGRLGGIHATLVIVDEVPPL